jgi:streptogramin lyase
VVTLGAYLPIWLHRAYRQARAASPRATRLTPGAAVSACLIPVLNAAGLAYLAVDLPRGLRRAAESGPGERRLETEPLSILILAAVFGGIGLALALDVTPLLAGFLAWPLELPAALVAQRALNSLCDEASPMGPGGPGLGAEAGPRRLDRETGAALTLAVVVLGAAGVALALGGDDGGGGGGGRPPAREQQADLASDIAASPGALWITRIQENRLERLDPETRRPMGTAVFVGETPLDIGAAAGSVWVAAFKSGTVARVDWESGQVEGRVRTGRGPFGVAATSRGVWVTNSIERTVVEIDPRTGRLARRPISVGRGPRGVAVGEGAVWVAAFDGRSVTRVDPSSGATREIRLGRAPQDVAAGEGAVWVTSPSEGLVTVIDPRSGKPDGTIQVGKMPSSVEVGLGSVWVALSEEGAVARIDPRTRQLEGRPLRVGGHLSDITLSQGAVWALRSDGTVKRLPVAR